MPGAVESFRAKCYNASHVTERHKMKRPSAPLGDLEHELLTILWKHGELTALDIGKQLARKLKDATIRTVLRRLEQKGYVTHTVTSGTFLYRATESAESAAANAVKGIVDRFCGGSIERGLGGLVGAALLGPNQPAAVARRLKSKPK